MIFKSIVLVFALLVCLPINLLAQPYEGEKGDVNNDGTVDLLDILETVNIVLGTKTPDNNEFWRADCNASMGNCNGDGNVDLLDIVKIANIILGNDECRKLIKEGTTDQDGIVHFTDNSTDEQVEVRVRNLGGDPVPDLHVWFWDYDDCEVFIVEDESVNYKASLKIYSHNSTHDIAVCSLNTSCEPEFSVIENSSDEGQAIQNFIEHAENSENWIEIGRFTKEEIDAQSEIYLFIMELAGVGTFGSAISDYAGTISDVWGEISGWEEPDHYDVYHIMSSPDGDLVGSIIVTFPVPKTPELILPSNESTISDINPIFEWDDIVGAIAYELIVDNTNDFSSNPEIHQSDLEESIYLSPISLSNDTYHWKVRAKGHHGNWGYWSNISTFTISTGGNTVTDIDGNVYQTVTIGTQVWMAENLKVTRFRNGATIPIITDSTDWSNLSTGAYCNYENNSNNATTYGRLYNWYAVNDSGNIAPGGWHVPSDDEWKQLEMYLGMSQEEADAAGLRGTDEGGKLKETGTAHWEDPNTGATNESGFSALPGGSRHWDGKFAVMGSFAAFWCSTDSNSYQGWSRSLGYFNSMVFRGGSSDKRTGLSVRCVKD
ncbi:MAG: hypothetical protein JSV84_04880 [Gemmatimonadota bacterium]|nr:MAG: hypothetical protein JSV84_04880 [Gemmatimonadota bacterium]